MSAVSHARALRRPRRAPAKRRPNLVDEFIWKLRSTAKIFFADLEHCLRHRWTAVETAARVDYAIFALILSIPDGEVMVSLTDDQRRRFRALRAELNEAHRWSTAAVDAARDFETKGGR